MTVNGVVDRTAGANALPANSTASFYGGTQRGYLSNVPESNAYTLVQSLDIPTIANYGVASPAYSVDNRPFIEPFSRVANYVELQTSAGELQYLWASMNAFTADANKVGVPTLIERLRHRECLRLVGRTAAGFRERELPTKRQHCRVAHRRRRPGV